MAVVAARLAVTDDARVGFDPHHRVASLHRRMGFRMAQKDGRDVSNLHQKTPLTRKLDG
jgi:hypothetical protein